ncbi:site-specific integrase, partial [Burkholderia multivorans]
SGAIFPTSVGTWLDKNNYAARFRQVREMADGVDLSWVTSHTIRKTVATQVYRSSDLKGASQQLGHSEVGVTSKHYIE